MILCNIPIAEYYGIYAVFYFQLCGGIIEISSAILALLYEVALKYLAVFVVSNYLV